MLHSTLMSKGHGTVQRSILDKLARHAAEHPAADDDHRSGPYASFLPVAELASSPDRADVESTRRALRKLSSESRVELLYQHQGSRRHLVARLTPEPLAGEAWWTEFDKRQAERAALWQALTRRT